MLQALRSRASGIIAKGLFVLLIASFAVWGIDASFFSSAPGPVVATVGEREITIDELTSLVRRNLAPFRGQIDDRQARQLGMVDRALEQLIDSAAMDVAATGIGLDASDAQIAAAIRNTPAFQNDLGSFDRFRYEQALRQAGLSEAGYVELVRSEVRSTMLAGSAIAGTRAPDALVRRLAAYRHEQRRAEILVVPAEMFTDLGTPDPAALQQIYEENQSEFMTPERRSATFVSLEVDRVAESIDVDDGAVRQAYQNRLDEFTSPERRSVSQVVGDEETMMAVASLIEDGQDFQTAVAAAAGQEPIDLGLVTRDEMLPEIADIAFSLGAGETSDAVESPLGWHVFHVSEVQEGGTSPFDAVRTEIESALKRDAALDKVVGLANQLEDLLAGGASLAEAGRTIGFPSRSVAALDRNGNGADGEPVSDLPGRPFLTEVFETPVGEQSLLRELPDGGYFVVSVQGTSPPEPRPLDAVRDEVAALWEEDARDAAAEEMAETIRDAAAAGTSLADLAETHALSVTMPEPFTRGETDPEVGLSQALVSRLFNARPGEVVQAPTDRGVAVAKLVETIDADLTAEETTDAVAEDVRGGIAGDIIQQLRSAVRNREGVEKNERAVDAVFPSQPAY